MKKNFMKRSVSLVLSITILFSMMTIGLVSVSALTSEKPATLQEEPSSVGAGDGSLNIDSLCGTGLTAVGGILVNIAQATNCEEFEAVASFLNVWAFGGDPTADTLSRIEDLCNDILSEVKQIDAKLDTYTSTIISELSKQNYGYLCDAMDAKWNKVKDCESKISIALNSYFNYDDFDEKVTTSSENISYFAAVSCYKNGTPDKNGNYFTADDIAEKRSDLFNAFCSIHGGMSSNADTYKKKADILFSDRVVDEIMQQAISDLITCIESAEYADACAKVAYVAYPNLSDQYEFVHDCIDRQFMELCMVEMLYEEYLAMRGEYLEKYYPYDENNPESVAMWNSYNGDNDFNKNTRSDVKELEKLNSQAVDAMITLLNTPLTLNSTGLTLSLGEYVKPEDLTGVVLNNTSYMSKFQNYTSEKPFKGYDRDIYGKYSSNAKTTSKSMPFNKIAVPTKDGVEIYYMTSGSAKDLVQKEYVGWFKDTYIPTCDFYNLTKGTYTDGVNSYTCVTNPQDESNLFNTGSYGLYSSNPSVYLSEYYKGKTDKNIYQIFPNYTVDDDGLYTDIRAYFTALQMNKDNIAFGNSTTKLDSRNDIYENSKSPYYTVFFKNSSNVLNNTLSSSVSGTGSADIYITNEKGEKITSGSKVECGDVITVHFKKTGSDTEFESLQILRYNDASNPNKVTSTETVLERNDFDYLKYDSKTGYYSVTMNMPYSNSKIVLNTTKGHNIDVSDSLNNSTITIHSNDNVFLEGDVITFDYEGKLDHVYLQYNGESHYVGMDYSNRTGLSTGSFTMPNSNVTVNITSDSTSSIFSKDANGNYIISSYDDLSKLSDVMQSYTKNYSEGNYVLTNDIDCNGKKWSPIGTKSTQFNGTFDGQNHSINNLNQNSGLEDGNRQPLFVVLGKDAVVKNLVVTNADVFTAENPVIGSGVIAKQNNGVISNCMVEKSSVQLGNWSYLGGITGFNNGTIENCGVVDTNITRRWGGSTTGTMGGITEFNNGSVKNCYTYNCIFTNGTSENGPIIAYGEDPVNCYYYTTSSINGEYGKSKTVDEFENGQVTYLLNKSSSVDPVWYQNIDNNLTKDIYPTLVNNGSNTVYKVNLSGKTYSNYIDGISKTSTK